MKAHIQGIESWTMAVQVRPRPARCGTRTQLSPRSPSSGDCNGETFVRFNPQKAGGASALLHDVRLMAMIFLANTHVVAMVVAVHRDEASVNGRITFRKYDKRLGRAPARHV